MNETIKAILAYLISGIIIFLFFRSLFKSCVNREYVTLIILLLFLGYFSIFSVSILMRSHTGQNMYHLRELSKNIVIQLHKNETIPSPLLNRSRDTLLIKFNKDSSSFSIESDSKYLPKAWLDTERGWVYSISSKDNTAPSIFPMFSVEDDFKKPMEFIACRLLEAKEKHGNFPSTLNRLDSINRYSTNIWRNPYIYQIDTLTHTISLTSHGYSSWGKAVSYKYQITYIDSLGAVVDYLSAYTNGSFKRLR